MKPRAQSYDEQLNRVRLMAADDTGWALNPYDLEALRAVVRHYDALASVVAAVNEVAKYDDFGEELSPGEELIAPRNPTAMNEARMRLYEALADEACREVDLDMNNLPKGEQ